MTGYLCDMSVHTCIRACPRVYECVCLYMLVCDYVSDDHDDHDDDDGDGCRTAAMVPSLLLTSGPLKCEAVLHGCGRSLVGRELVCCCFMS